MFWLLKRFKKSAEPKKRKKKGLIAILLVIGVIAFQNFAPKDSELRMKIEDAVNSVTDLLPWLSGSFRTGRTSAYSGSRNSESPVTVTIDRPGEADHSGKRGKAPTNSWLTEIDPKKQDVDWPSESPTCHMATLIGVLTRSVGPPRRSTSRATGMALIWVIPFGGLGYPRYSKSCRGIVAA